MTRFRTTLHAAGMMAVVAFGTSGFVGARLLSPASGSASPVPSSAIASRFEPWDLVLDPDGAALAAWQVSIECASGGAVSLVGVEGGAAAVFREPPAYDPEAHRAHRIVLANFSLADAAELPTEPFRATTLHLQMMGPAPDLSVRIDAAAGPDGHPMPVHAELRRRATP